MYCYTFSRLVLPVAPGSSQGEHLLGSSPWYISQCLALYYFINPQFGIRIDHASGRSAQSRVNKNHNAMH